MTFSDWDSLYHFFFLSPITNLIPTFSFIAISCLIAIKINRIAPVIQTRSERGKKNIPLATAATATATATKCEIIHFACNQLNVLNDQDSIIKWANLIQRFKLEYKFSDIYWLDSCFCWEIEMQLCNWLGFFFSI